MTISIVEITVIIAVIVILLLGILLAVRIVRQD